MFISKKERNNIYIAIAGLIEENERLKNRIQALENIAIHNGMRELLNRKEIEKVKN